MFTALVFSAFIRCFVLLFCALIATSVFKVERTPESSDSEEVVLDRDRVERMKVPEKEKQIEKYKQ